METKSLINKIFDDSINAKKNFACSEENIIAIEKAAKAIVECYKRGGKVFVFGNGGSAADSQHLAAEMVVRFELDRKALPCIALTTDSSILTAVSNDYDFSQVFSRQIEALAGEKDLVIAISTSGTSANVVKAVKKSKEKNIQVIALSGRDGGVLAKEASLAIVVREKSTARIQEVHGTIIHALCCIVENSLAG